MKCLNCNIETQKPKKKFCSNLCESKYWNKNHKEKCKKSHKKFMEKVDKDYFKKYYKKYYKKGYSSEWRRKHPKKYKEQLIRKHIRERLNPTKMNAWRNDYKRKQKECYLCGGNLNLQFHHINYKEHKGITLCFDCHRKLHRVKKLFERGLLINKINLI